MRGHFGAPREQTRLECASVEGRENAAERCPGVWGPGGQASASSAVILYLLQSLVNPPPSLGQARLLETFDHITRSGKPDVKNPSADPSVLPNVTSPRPSRFARLQDVGDKGRHGRRDRRHAPIHGAGDCRIFRTRRATTATTTRHGEILSRRVPVLSSPFLISQTEHDRLLIERHRNSGL